MNKIAFLFLTQKELTQEKLWDTFFGSADKDKYSLYFHAKPDFTHNKFSEFQIDSIETAWGSFSLVEAQQLLFNEALKDEDNKHFILVSETTIPICSFEEMYFYFSDKENYSIIGYSNANIPYFLQRIELINNLYNWTSDNWYVSSQWVILNREHCKLFKNNISVLKDIFNDSPHPEEHSYVTFLNHLNLLNDSFVINKSLTFVDWNGNNSTMPSSYKPNEITESLIKKLKDEGYFFMRKVMSGSDISIF
jgi:hypothetical protein